MIKFRKKLLAVLLTAAMLISMSSMVAWSDEQPAVDEGAQTTEEAADDTQQDEASGDDDEVVEVDPQQKLSEMKKVAENDNYKLFLDEKTTVFAVQSKADDYIWWSSPVNGDADPIANGTFKEKMQSPFYLKYGDIGSRSTQEDFNAYANCIKSGRFTISEIENGVRIDYTMNKIEAVIPMTIVLEKDNVTVSILTEEIVEPTTSESAGFSIIEIGLLQFFGASDTDDDGYLVVPDGSGAVINFNNGKINAQKYSNDVYGRDSSVSLAKKPAKNEQVYLPILGSVTNGGDEAGHGFLAIAKSGETCATVNAAVSEQSSTSYNSVWFRFKVRAEDSYTIGGKTLNIFEKGKIDQPTLSVSYYPMQSEDLSYMDMAERYRQYLIEEMGLTEKKDTIKSSYYLGLYGGTVKAQSIAGFPINMQTPATTYEQAQQILTNLHEKGVNDIMVTYHDFNTAGIKGLISAGVDYASALGGKSKYQDLSQYATSIGAQVYPSVGFTYMKDSGNGYSFALNACKQITNAYATSNNWDIAFGIPHQVRLVPRTTLAPYYWTDLFRKLETSFSQEGIKTICLDDATTHLYSDYSRGNYSRYDALQIMVEGYKKFKDAGFTVLANAANAYALPYVDYITNVPLSSSNYDLFDYDIPLYQAVIHGIVPYTSKAFNASANASDTIMLALATATPVHYEMMYENPNKFTDSDYDSLFYSNYKGWVDSSVNIYKLYKENLDGFTNLKMTDYVIDGDVIESTFEGGKTIKVNTRELTLTVDGKDVDLTQYGLKGESDE